MSMIHRPISAGFFAALAVLQSLLALWLAIAVVQMLVDPERFQHADASIGIALAGAVAFSVTTVFSFRAASAMWRKWKTGRQQGGPSEPVSETDQTE